MGSGKYAGVDFSAASIRQWTSDLECSDKGFRCSKGEFVTFWRKGRIKRDVRLHIGHCWVITHDDILVAYITLLADRLTVEEAILEGDEVPYLTFPAVKIGLLAVDNRAQGCGIGKKLVDWALEYVATNVAPLIGVRYVTVDALYDKDEDPPYDMSGFYHKMGFQYAQPDEPLPPEEPYSRMFFDLKELIEGVSGSSITPM